MANKFIISQILLLFFALSLNAQRDSSRSELSFDLGLTRDKNINLWPILKYSKTEFKKEFHLFSPILKSSKDYSTLGKHFHFLPFFINDSSTEKRDFRFLSTYYPSLIRWYNDYQKGIKSFRFLELAPHINMLEFSQSNDGFFVQNNLLFLLWYKNDISRKKSHLIIFPFYWAFHSPKRSTNSFLPLYSYGKFNEASGQYFAITPFYWNIKKPGIQKSTFLPIYWRKETAHANLTTTKVKVLPFYWSVTSDQLQKTVLFPLYWSRSSSVVKNKIVFPFLWSLNSHDYKSLTLFPLFSYGNSYDKNERHMSITPVFLHKQKQDNLSNMLFPIWWYRQTGFGRDQEVSNIIIPFWLSHKSRDSKTNILFPIYCKFQTPKYKSTTLLPFYSKGYSQDSINQHLIVSPLYWKFNSFQRRSTFLFPIWWQRQAGHAETLKTTNFVFPVYYSKISHLKQNKIVFPILFYNKNPKYRSFTFFPLFSCGKDTSSQKNHKIISPLFWHFSKNNRHSNTLFPFWWNNKIILGDSSNSSNIVFPIYWSYKDNFKTNYTFLPFFSKGTYNNNQNKYLAITPLYWKFITVEGSESLFFLFWYNKKLTVDKSIKQTQIGFPLYWSYLNREKKTKIIFPVSWYFKNNNYTNYLLFPFIFKRKSADDLNILTAITPIFWRRKSPKNSFNTVFPIWWHKKRYFSTDTSYSNVVFPIFWSYKNNYKKNYLFFPIVWKFKNPSSNTFTFFPLYSVGCSADGTNKYTAVTPFFWHRKSSDYKSSTVFPLWWNKKRYFESDTSYSNVLFPIVWSYKNNIKKNNIVFPIFWKFQNPDYYSFTFFPIFSKGISASGSKRFTAITPFFWQHKSPDYKSSTIFPLWWHKKRYFSSDTSYTNILFPFIWSYKNNIKRMTTVFPFWWGRTYKNDSEYSHTRYLFPMYWNEKNSGIHNRIVFPLVWSLKNMNYSSFTALPFLSYGKSPDKRKKHLVITPFFWDIKTPVTKRTSIVPLFNSYAQNNDIYNFDLFYILFRYKREETSKSFQFLWPLCQYKSDSLFNYFRFAPVIWYKKTEDYRFFSFQPFFYYQNSALCNEFHLFWQLFVTHHYFNHKKSRHILWKALWWDNFDNGDHEFRLFHLLFAHMKKQGQVEKSFFPFYHIRKDENGNRSVAVLFYFYHYFKRQVPESNKFYQEEKIFWFIRLRSNYNKILTEQK